MLLDNRFVYSASNDAFARPASGGQEHSPPKVTDDGIQKYEKTLVSRQAINTLIRMGVLRPTSMPARQQRKKDVAAVVPRRSLKPVKARGSPTLPAPKQYLCMWQDSRDNQHRLLTWSDNFPGAAVPLTTGRWVLEERIVGDLNVRMRNQEFDNRERAITELGKRGYYEFRISAAIGNSDMRKLGLERHSEKRRLPETFRGGI
ncbi:MAG TPA: hypothetical protein VMU57_17820 [Edaphobacter sp.]|uniref:hypothetical protein n=1 Tax=Edaphobacter sp. TaxID=1934404 RepID=UPI002B9F9DF1|nr:hypothetical protein [Edaphobacter sp.]HUZ96765.1 hypothetical protein [Edaphobacter sp.]